MRSRTLTAEESRVVGILCDDWRNLLHCTTIDQAMERAGVPFSHAQRLRIAKFLLTNARAGSLMRWGPTAYVLTNDEKLFTRLTMQANRRLGAIPKPSELVAAGLDLDSSSVSDAFETLQWLGFLQRSGREYELAPNHARFLSAIGLYFHEVVLPGRDERFNTNCALDFFIMTHPPTRESVLAQITSGNLPEVAGEGMSQKMIEAIRVASHAGRSALAEAADYTHERAILNDACGWTHEPIGVALDQGKLVEVTPETTWYLRGGG